MAIPVQPLELRIHPSLPDLDGPRVVLKGVAATQDRVRALETQLRDQQLEHSEALRQVQQQRLGLASQVDVLSRQLAEANKVLQERQALIGQQQERIQELEHAHQEGQEQIQALRGQVEAVRQETSALALQVALLTQQLQAAITRERSESQVQIERLTSTGQPQDFESLLRQGHFYDPRNVLKLSEQVATGLIQAIYRGIGKLIN